jgi:shikimate kinase
MDHDDAALLPGDVSALARRIDRPVVLVGMMGVGKSSIGRRLASVLDLPFADADEEIETAAQLSIAEIFERHGEPYFRDGERRVIARLMDGVPKVIATGGGAFVNAETRALILDRGVAVWLDADVDTLVERTSRKHTRPLLRSGDPREILARLRSERESAYAQAPIHVISGRGVQARTVARVLKEIEKWI